MKVDLSEIISNISGLNPKASLVLSTGFVREEWKALCFKRGNSISASAVQNSKQFAQSFILESRERLLDREARIELLKRSFRDPNLKNALPKIFEHRFRPNFFETLDRTLSKGRELFAHLAEAKVLEARLIERVGYLEKREEFFLLNQFWESLLDSRNLWDEAKVYEWASRRLMGGESQPSFQKIYHLEHFTLSPRLRFFWEEVSRRFEVITIKSSDLIDKASDIGLSRNLAHSLEDGAQSLFDELIEKGGLGEQAVVIEDRPEVRRTLKRIASERGIKFMDPRDPTLFIQSEEIKTAFLELEMVARNFNGELVLSWISAKFSDSGKLRRQVIEAGISESLESYRFIPEIYLELQKIKESYSSRMTLPNLEVALFQSCQNLKLNAWVSEALSKTFKSALQSLTLIGEEAVKRPLRIWLEELKERIETSPPLVDPFKNEFGLKLFRVDQAISLPLMENETKIHFFGVSQNFFESKIESSSWFSHRDVETLSSEFAIPSVKEREVEARQSFLSWAKVSRKDPCFWEYRYDETGSEQESLELVLSALPQLNMKEVSELPVHESVLPSLTLKLKAPEKNVKVSISRVQFPISFLNSLGNCAFTGYAQHLLALYDERDPDFDLSGDTFGNLVHAAIEYLISAKSPVTPEEAFLTAWKTTAKLAWMKSDRLFRALKKKTILILENFLESEKEYRLRSKSELISQEIPIELKRMGLTFKGRMDRIDQHADGIVLMDYKTSGVLPSGKDTIQKLKGLQLPAYALAIKETMNQEVVGAQYIQLHGKKTNRNLGFLFSNWNKSKAADKIEFPLSTARSNSNSLILEDPETVWADLDQKIKDLLLKVKAGEFKAEPADAKDCVRCRYAIVCGQNRGFSEVVGDETP